MRPAKPSVQQSGFVSIVLLATLPMLISIFLAISLMFFMLNQKSYGDYICRKQHLSSHHDMAEALNRLESLNPRARSLRRQLVWAQRALRAAQSSGYPAAIALAQANLIRVQISQAVHAGQQNLAFFQATSAYTRIQQNQNANVANSHSSHIGFTRHTQLNPLWSLLIQRRPPQSVTPNYEIPDHLSIAANASSEWSIGFDSYIRDLLGSYWNEKFQTFDLQWRVQSKCKSGLIKKDGQWVARLKRDRFWWN